MGAFPYGGTDDTRDGRAVNVVTRVRAVPSPGPDRRMTSASFYVGLSAVPPDLANISRDPGNRDSTTRGDAHTAGKDGRNPLKFLWFSAA
jgi:hypothetical protein